MTPYGAAGNFFRDESRRANRQEWLINEFVRPVHWHGSHQFEAGADVQRSDLDEIILRHEFSVVRVDNSVVRNVLFLGSPRQFRTNIEAYSYALDRWNPRPDLTIEAGFRTQWDEYTRGAPPAPRLAAAWSPRWSGGAKFSAGWGIFYDAVTLGMLALSQEQTSVSTFYGPSGLVQGAPVASRFILRPQDLRLPRFAIASFSAERRLPWNVYGRLNLIARQGSRGFSFEEAIVNSVENAYILDNIERQRYRALRSLLQADISLEISLVCQLHEIGSAIERCPRVLHREPDSGGTNGRSAGLGCSQPHPHVGVGSRGEKMVPSPAAAGGGRYRFSVPHGLPDRIPLQCDD